ncbi:type IV fimbrial biogenesis protein FimT [Cupriavidus sp. OV038]|jgi:type IV fimbrial biogenesis protein FimT|uniref:GspH/FimT family pseudopilin n=1 Tax=unclassified Cupriavidus TaxID=2640874 RepID=UPI0008E15F0A|nr:MULTISPECIES: GspH/FimT family pseudopilin [unclassified Cupriavidus]SFB77862.1 type IV fimbrial biogenesis protein FimT [Cupriavidus sp. OV038]SFO65259.1 type IV fimbrial biogenesis protein FimT [Cupriavidus sp. OV096]
MQQTAIAHVRRRSGMTLTELLVSLAVAAILAAIALPTLRHMLAEHTVTYAADRLAASLAMARTTAANRRVEIRLGPLPGATTLDGGWQLAPVAPQATTGPPIAVTALDAACLRVTLRGTDGAKGPPALRLTPVGYSRSERGGFYAATFHVRCRGAQRQVRLGAQGRIRICGAGPDADCD